MPAASFRKIHYLFVFEYPLSHALEPDWARSSIMCKFAKKKPRFSSPSSASPFCIVCFVSFIYPVPHTKRLLPNDSISALAHVHHHHPKARSFRYKRQGMNGSSVNETSSRMKWRKVNKIQTSKRTVRIWMVCCLRLCRNSVHPVFSINFTVRCS